VFIYFGTLFHCSERSANMSDKHTLYRLDGTASSLVISDHLGVPGIVWFGDKLDPNVDLNPLLGLDDVALPFGTLDAPAPLTLVPQSATGFMGSAALSGSRPDSARPSHFSCTSITQHENSLTCLMNDARNQIELVMRLSLDVSDVISISTSIKNTGSNDFSVQWLAAATIPLPGHYTKCISQHGRWGLEYQSHESNISVGRQDISNQHGRTGHAHVPSVICAANDLSEDSGDNLFVHLGWSGNYSFRVERLQDGVAYLQAGVLLNSGEERLAANETLQTPTLYMTRGNGLNQCTQRFHQFARKNILPQWTRTNRPIHANSWEAMYFSLNDADLCSLVDAAAKVGAERFILDYGWFPADTGP